MEKVSFIILAGGKSRRMGKDKRFIKFKEKYFIEHVLKTAEKISDDIIISVDKIENMNLKTKHKVIEDIFDIGAPLIGIFSALKHCKYNYTCVLPCDAPLANAKVFAYMIERSRGYDGVVPKDGEYIEPLHAVYKVKPLLKACEESIKNKKYKISEVLNKLNIYYIPVDELRKFDKNLLTLKNINTPEDLKELEKCV